jgi:hypothetical protein
MVSVNELGQIARAAESAKRRKAPILKLGSRAEYKAVAAAVRRQPGVGPFTAICVALEIATLMTRLK